LPINAPSHAPEPGGPKKNIEQIVTQVWRGETRRDNKKTYSSHPLHLLASFHNSMR
jgi:hypothetical protein